MKGNHMKRLLAAALLAGTAATAQQVAPVVGSINGTLSGEDGASIAGGTIFLHLASPQRSRLARQQTDWTTETGPGGGFFFDGLPEGTYTVCARVKNSLWLNPCEWKFPTPTATVSRTASAAKVSIALKQGVAIPVRINDTSHLLDQHLGKTPGAGLMLSLSGPGLLSRLVPLVSQDSGGRDYQIVVPFNTPLALVLLPTYFKLNDANGSALATSASSKLALVVASGQRVTPIQFTVVGVGN